jgi:hypothetical protein
MAKDFANFTLWLKENLVPQHEAEFRMAEKQCFDSNNNQYTGMDMAKFFKKGYQSLIWDAVPKSVRDSVGIMGNRGTPTAPWYLYEVIDHDTQEKEFSLANLLFSVECWR